MADTANALLLARQHLQAGRLQQAEAIYRQVLDAEPRHADVWKSLGVLHYRQRQLDEAVGCFHHALALRPNFPEVWSCLGFVRHEQQRSEEAVRCFREALALQPDNPEVVCNLAATYWQLQQPEMAVACLQDGLAHNSRHPQMHRTLARIYIELAAKAAALNCFENVLLLCPADSEALFMVEALRGQSDSKRVPAECVAALYDERAAHFDQDPVERLGYCSPQWLKAALEPGPPPHSLDVLDLGCGTGLCGVQFRNWARTLIGVDLSPKMLARARERQLYDELICADLLAPLQENAHAFDLVLASDVLLYLGDLEPLMQAVRRALRPGGRFAFTVDLDIGPEYRLLPGGHFAHSRAYLQKLATQTHLREVHAREASFPRASGRQAAGLVAIWC